MKVIVISGSPRKSGMTSILMSYVLEYVKQKDVEVKFINLAEDGFECYRGDPVNLITKEKFYKLQEM